MRNRRNHYSDIVVSILAVACLAVGIGTAVAPMTGCASSTPTRVAFNTIDDTVTGVQAAMGAFNERYQAGLQTNDDRTKVLDVYAKFQKTARLAATLAQDASQHVGALKMASDAAFEVLDLIAALTPKKGATP